MKPLLRLAAVVSLLGGLASAQAQEVLPGLWELSSDSMQVNGQQLPPVQELLGQLEGLPAEQRQMLEEAMAGKGIQAGGQGLRVCLSEAQVKAQELPLQDAQSGCTQEITERSERLWKFRFRCPDAEGEGETRFVSEREFVTRIDSRFSAAGQAGNSRMQTHARWLGADCGELAPRS
ncbi:conserved exported hypothetical protein [Pseudomonas sp. OF001]|jgi:hypothetical protein|uniref:DUF3617 domain-containing protein n=1 Tax=Pseudomonas sp. OF001 TaxID=2772300 RepID=UPI001917CBC1|nr:DUF3617 domain-containing protein [Pseudomonas sp. OF001]CAD5376636.1 conserved exported hypothetical protein [Pseudomonas sp. OF001]